MTTPATNVSFADINTELGRSSSFQFSMNDVSARLLSQVTTTPNSLWGLASAQNRTSYNQSMTVGKDPSLAIYGYNNPSVGGHGGNAYGSLSPASALGNTIGQLSGSTSDASILILGVFAQASFNLLLLKTNVNSDPFAIFQSSQATFNVIASTYSQWIWSAIGGFSWPALNGTSIVAQIQK